MTEQRTPLERRVYQYMIDFLAENTYQPSIREIAKRFHIKSTKTVSDLLHSLTSKGYIERDQSRSRGVRILGYAAAGQTQPVPFYGRIHNGFTYLPLNELPIFTKQMVMEHFDELVTDPALRLADVEAHLAGRTPQRLDAQSAVVGPICKSRIHSGGAGRYRARRARGATRCRGNPRRSPPGRVRRLDAGRRIRSSLRSFSSSILSDGEAGQYTQ
jgi:hypothetical protein